MFTSNPHDALLIAHQLGRRLREETAAERLRPASRMRCPVAAYLRRRAASRRGPASLAHRSA